MTEKTGITGVLDLPDKAEHLRRRTESLQPRSYAMNSVETRIIIVK